MMLRITDDLIRDNAVDFEALVRDRWGHFLEEKRRIVGTRQLLTVLALCLTVGSLLVPGYPLLTLAVLLLCVGLLV